MDNIAYYIVHGIGAARVVKCLSRSTNCINGENIFNLVGKSFSFRLSSYQKCTNKSVHLQKWRHCENTKVGCQLYGWIVGDVALQCIKPNIHGDMTTQS